MILSGGKRGPSVSSAAHETLVFAAGAGRSCAGTTTLVAASVMSLAPLENVTQHRWGCVQTAGVLGELGGFSPRSPGVQKGLPTRSDCTGLSGG